MKKVNLMYMVLILILFIVNFAVASSWQVIYQTDFTSDPFSNGWVTNNSDRYKHSDAEGLPPGSLYTENYTNSGDWAITDIEYNGETFHLEFDVKPTQRDTGDVCIGLFGPNKVSSSGGDTEERLYVLFGGYGSQIYIHAYNSGGEFIGSGPGSGLMVVNEWHHVVIYYDSTSKSVDFQVTRNGIPVLSWQTMMNYGFSSDLLYLGVSMNGSWVTSNRYELAYIDNIEMCVAPAQVSVSIDIKPGSGPNAINLGSNGLIPVAILSSEDFDATIVDPDTVELAGSGVAVRGKSNRYMAHEEDVNGDGLVDLVLQVATANLYPDSFQDGVAVLSGQTYDGVAIEGSDEITIVPTN